MAVDTRKKRASALTIGPQWGPPGLLADGTINATDRQQIGWGYIGVVPSGGTATGGALYIPTYRPRRRSGR